MRSLVCGGTFENEFLQPLLKKQPSLGTLAGSFPDVAHSLPCPELCLGQTGRKQRGNYPSTFHSGVCLLLTETEAAHQVASLCEANGVLVDKSKPYAELW